MKLLIVGSRSIKDFDLSPYIPEDVELIISGGQKALILSQRAMPRSIGSPDIL